MEAVDPLGRRPPPSQEQFGMVDGEVAVELTETRGRDEPAALTAPRARVGSRLLRSIDGNSTWVVSSITRGSAQPAISLGYADGWGG